MTQAQPAASSPPSASAAPVEITENQAILRAWVLFTVLFVVVICLLWVVQSRYG
ncbi:MULTISPECIES: hypothetical protein [unclassified Variovorax]|jgi:hypothetical protein|uniref:hypothetical protein n=1 Tax=unclassified Variovorax TaxID=663243 RepID=UPI0013DF5005|nr:MULTISPECIES: hypothetical protein [unclassified Variovorax]